TRRSRPRKRSKTSGPRADRTAFPSSAPRGRSCRPDNSNARTTAEITRPREVLVAADGRHLEESLLERLPVTASLQSFAQNLAMLGFCRSPAAGGTEL